MFKQMSSKRMIIVFSTATIVVLAAIVILLLNREEAYRSIMVYEMEGSAVIERADIGTIDAAENLYLESGDRVSVYEASMMRMKLDSDKYITAESDTVFSLEAQGGGQDSKTRINLEQGAITNEIQNPLSKGSTYETVTPNSVMAVRGTIYRVELYDGEAGGQDVRLCCFDGAVATTPILPDGTMGEEVLVQAGSELTVYGDGTVGAIQNIDFESLPLQAIETLSAMADSGAAIAGITGEELAGMISSYEQSDETVSEEAEIPEKVEDTEKADTSAAAVQKSAQDSNDSSAANNKKSNNNTQTGRSVGTNNGQPAENAAEQTEQKLQNNTMAPAPPDVSGSADTDGVPDDQNTGDRAYGGEKISDDKDRDHSDRDHEKPSGPVIYTVTFQYGDGEIFASQIVVRGGKATRPVLAPAPAGDWDYDFDKPVMADTIIKWTSEPGDSD